MLTADFGLPDGAFSVATGDGVTWLAAGSSVLRIDPRTDRSRPVLSTTGASFTTDVFGDGDLWVGDSSELLRIDALTGKVTGRVDVSSGRLGFGDGYVWSLRQTSLVRVDPRTLAARQFTLPFAKIWGFAAGEGAVWISSTGSCRAGGGCLLKVDPSSGRVTAQVEGTLALASVAVGDGAVWASDGTTVEKVDPVTDRVTLTTALLAPFTGPGDVRSVYGSGLLAVAPGVVWVTVAAGFRAARLARIDPVTGRLIGSQLQLGGSPASITASDTTVWIVTGQDALARFDLVSCGRLHCPAPAPPAPPVPSKLLRPIDLVSLQMFSAGDGWGLAEMVNAATGSPSGVFPARTTDGGRSWRDVTPAPELANGAPVALFALTAERAFLVDVSGSPPGPRTTILVTGDGGRTWHRLAAIPTGGGDFLVDFTDESHGWLLVGLGAAAGADAVTLYRTTDGARTWSIAARTPSLIAPNSGGFGGLPLPCAKTGLEFENDQVGWMSIACNAGGGGLLVTRDGGRNWTFQQSVAVNDCPGPPCAVSTPQFSGATGFAVVRTLGPARLLVTHDSGASWRLARLPAGAGAYPDVYFINASTGFLVAVKANGTDGSLLVTTDGGRNWTSLPSHPGYGQLDFVNGEVGFAWGSYATGASDLWSTTDGGKHWTSSVPVLHAA